MTGQTKQKRRETFQKITFNTTQNLETRQKNHQFLFHEAPIKGVEMCLLSNFNHFYIDY